MKLATRLAAQSLRVDPEKGIIYGAAVMTRGPAETHGFEVDDVMLRQIAVGINAIPLGAPVRVSHPTPGGGDPIFTLVGRCVKARVEGPKVLGDVQLGAYAAHTPAGDLRKWILALAQEDPSAIGLSVEFMPAPFVRQDGRVLGRVASVEAVDFTARPAANPAGLLSSRGGGAMTKALRTYLQQIGLKADATEEEATVFLAGLSADQKEISEALAAQDAAPAPTPEPQLVPAALVKAAAQVERTRVRGLAQMVQMGLLPAEKLALLVETGATPEQASALALGHLATTRAPLPIGGGPGPEYGNVHVGAERNRGSLAEAMTDAILLRANVSLVQLDQRGHLKLDKDKRPTYRDPHPRAVELRGLSIVDMARLHLRTLGIPGADGMAAPRVLRMAFDPRTQSIALAQSTSDFAGLLGDALGKSLLAAYAEYPVLWPLWCARRTHPDFKQIKLLNLDALPNLRIREEGGGIKYVTIGESKEVYALAEFTAGVKLTRQAIINDDMDAFARLPGMMAASARRLEDVVTLAVLTANANMGDEVPLFDAGHGNLAGSGAGPTVETLNAARSALRLQKSGDDAFLALQPKTLLASTALEGTVQELLESKLRATVAGTAAVDNPWAGKLTYGVHPLLDQTIDADTDAKSWYVAADPVAGRGVEVCFLEDEQEPQQKQETEFDTDDLRMAVRHTVAAKAADYRGVYKNPGD